MPGSLQDLGNGKYRIQVRCGRDAEGKEIKFTKVVEARSKRAAEVMRDKFYYDVKKLPPKNSSRIKFADFCTTYDERYLKSLSPTTRRTTLNDIENRILPFFGAMYLGKISEETIQLFLEELAQSEGKGSSVGKRLSKGTVFKFFRILRAVLNKAVEWKYISVNPCNIMSKDARPKNIHAKRAILQEDELKIFLKKLFALPDNYTNTRHQLMAYLMLIAGLRRGELFALTYDSFNFSSNIMTIDKALYEVKGDHGIKEPKTASSNRQLYIDNIAKKLLLKNRAYQDEWLVKRGLSNPKGIVFTKVKGIGKACEASYASLSSLDQWLEKFTSDNCLPHISAHALRHMACSYALANGADLSSAQALLGHDKISTTAIYSHAIEQRKQKTMHILSDAYEELIDGCNE